MPRVGAPVREQHGFIAALRHLLERRIDRDGEAPELERLALVAGEDEGGSRRERSLGRPQEIIDRALSQKILHGWLQNRHQVLVPLTFRLNRLGAADAGLLMRFAAAALLNASSTEDAARRGLETWLKGSGADDAALDAFRAALETPDPLDRLIAAVRDAAPHERGLGSFAYAVAVAAADLRSPAGRLFADYIAARLMLPADAVRSVDRRARR